MWDLLIVDPITNLLLLFYQWLGNNTVLALALVTLVMRLITMPLTLNQQKGVRKQQELQPKLRELQEKYKNDKERLSQEQLKLYSESGMNPMSGCFPLLLQFPLLIGLYQAIIRALATTPLELLALPQHVYRGGLFEGLSTLAPLQSQFLWLDLALPDPIYVLPILVAATTWLQQKLLTPPTAPGGDPQAESMSQSMQITMPLFMGFISMSYASGLSTYFVVSNLIGILQYYLFRKHYTYAPAADAAAKGKTDRPLAKAKSKAE